MLHKDKSLIYLLIWVSILVISSCSPKYTTPRTGEEFFQEISRLEKLSMEDPDPSVRAKSHLQLARLYTSYKNPQRDYLKGCKEFEAYLAVAPADRENDDLQDWVSVLKELEKSQKELEKSEKELEESEKEAAGLKGKIVSLTDEMNLQLKKNKELQGDMEKLQGRLGTLENRLETLEKRNRSLSQDNRKLKQAMEMLKKLDQEMERKRRSIR